MFSFSAASLNATVHIPEALRHVRKGATRRRSGGRVGAAVTPRASLFPDLGQILGSIKRKEGILELPPGRVGLFGARETIEYLQDPRAFIKKRVEMYGPVFKTGFFFKPAIVFGSKEAIEEYRQFEATLPADEALPETFRELHTAYGALRQSGAQHKARQTGLHVVGHFPMKTNDRLETVAGRDKYTLRGWHTDPGLKATRANFGKVLGRAALAHYAPIIARQTRDFVQGDLMLKGTLQPGYECRQFCLRSLFELFIGTVPPEDTMMKMYDYNEGLLALGKLSPEFSGGKQALEDLTEFILKHYRTVRAQGKLEEPEYFFLKQYSEAVDEDGELFTDDRIATTCVLMVWGAYIEAAASMGHTAWLLLRNPEAASKVREECRATLSSQKLRAADINLETAMEMKYTEAAVKEALRVVPQTAGGLRINPETRKLAGYDIPAGYTLTADPRIPFLDPNNFPEPEEFRPERFLPQGETAGNNVTADTYFPGGMGQHQCPGMNLSQLMTQMFLAYMTCTFDSWEPDLEDEGSEDPQYIHVPIVIIDDRYLLKLERNWQYDL